MDPEGNNFSEFEKTLITTTELIKLWWIGEGGHISPNPTEEEAKRLVAKMNEQLENSPLTDAYRQIEQCMKLLYLNVRFNKSHLRNVHPSPLLPSLIASFATMLQNPNNLSPANSRATTIMEEECLTELAELIGFPRRIESSRLSGNIVSCGTISNLTALMVAREKAYGKFRNREGYSIKEAGLFRAPNGVIITSKSAHYSIRKAAKILGLGESSVIEIPIVDEKEVRDFEQSGTPLKLKPSEDAYAEILEKIEKLTNVGGEKQKVVAAVPTLGTINTGTIEKVKPLGSLRKRFGFHLHVDAAIGGLALGLNEVRQKAEGVELADSITVDPHKLGFVPYPCSAILFRDKSDLELISMGAPYLDTSGSTIEGSRTGTGIAAFWVAIKTLGTNGYAEMIGKCIGLTRYLGELLKDRGYQIIHEIDLNTMCFSLWAEDLTRKRANRLTSELHDRIIADGRYLVGKVEDIPGVRVRDKPWLGDSEKTSLTGIKTWIMNPQMNEKDIESLANVIEEKRRELNY
jgi:glutamate/tyrosine decarboxylase-like PLP-dependent enzyme